MQLDDVKIISAIKADKQLSRYSICFVPNQKKNRPYGVNHIDKLYVGNTSHPAFVYRLFVESFEGEKAITHIISDFYSAYYYMKVPRVTDVVLFEGVLYTGSHCDEIGCNNFFRRNSSGQIEIIPSGSV